MGIFGSKEDEPHNRGLPAKQARPTEEEMKEAHRDACRGPRSHPGFIQNERLPDGSLRVDVNCAVFGKYKIE